MTMAQVMIDDDNITSLERDKLANYQLHNAIGVEEADRQHIRDSILVRWCVDNIPKPPTNYHFSFRQRIDQYDFFQSRFDLIHHRFLDLYNAAIVIACKSLYKKEALINLHFGFFLVDEHCSDEMRHLVQALLIAHAEPKLNIIMNPNHDFILKSDNCSSNHWRQHLIHPRLRSPTVQLA